MRMIWLVIGLVLIGAGAVWIAQGLNLPFAPSSFMTRDFTWVLVGALAIVAGIVAVAWSRRAPPATR